MLIRGSQTANKAGGKDEVEVKQQAREKSLLSLYAEAPTGEIRLEEFEQFSIDRLMGARVQLMCTANPVVVVVSDASLWCAAQF